MDPSYTMQEIRDSGFWDVLVLDKNVKASPFKLRKSDDDHEYYAGLRNWRVITRYNSSRMYATTVALLAERLKESNETND